MDLDLNGRVALVTGGGAGIGEAIARAFAAERCSVVIADRDDTAAKRVTASIERDGCFSHAVTLDVGDNEAVEEAFAVIRRKAGAPHILVNAAGVLSVGAIADLPVGEFDRVARVNIDGVLNCVRAAIPMMTAARSGRIINIASISAMRGGGSVGNTLYGATKSAVVALTMGLARELGPSGITVNAVAPAIVETAMTRAALTDNVRGRILPRIPLGRFATSDDVANLVVFLASGRASFITGAVIPVDGGILTT